MKRLFLLFLGIFIIWDFCTIYADDPSFPPDRWQIQQDGSILWDIDTAGRLPHCDHIEASGEEVSTVFYYNVNENKTFSVRRSLIWPMLRLIPNNTHASLMRSFEPNIVSLIQIDGKPLEKETVENLTLNGFLTVNSVHEQNEKPILFLTRKIFPSTIHPFICERYLFTNISDHNITVTIPEYRTVETTDAKKCVNGSYTIISAIADPGQYKLSPNASAEFNFSIQAFSTEKGESEQLPDFALEETKRKAFVDEMWSNLVFESPNPVINRMFDFAKIRVSESIYRTARGLMHGPGGESYYAAIWANDQAEYTNPFFPFLGYKTGNESAFNAYLHFARYMNIDYKPIPPSIIAEGFDSWGNGFDRGDAAMIAYGASRYALVRSDETEARRLYPLIEWCLEYCRRNLNESGVVKSMSDELEGRFPAGDANLCTSTLYYDALLSTVFLGRELCKPEEPLKTYVKEAVELRKNIENYFGAEVEGFKTYRYYNGNDLLRSWICMPLVVGITERADETINALFSDKLWTINGLLTQSGTETYWDRSTLYALRGVFAAGAIEKAAQYLDRYSRFRLLGDHVPYAVEAWPEGSQRHLSAESGLYCRIITEGIFGIRPTGFHSFRMTPRLPVDWNKISLKKIRGFGATSLDITAERDKNGKITVTLTQTCGEKIEKASAAGEVFDVKIHSGESSNISISPAFESDLLAIEKIWN